MPLNLGANPIQVVARDRVGNSETVSITVTRQAPAPSQIRLISGNNQTGSISTQVPAPLVVQLIGADGNPSPNVPVVFRVAARTTDWWARAVRCWPLDRGEHGWQREGAGATGHWAAARAPAATAWKPPRWGIGGTAIFTPPAPRAGRSNIVVDTGDAQTGSVSTPLPRPLIAVVVDGGNNRLANVPVTFTVMSGGGNFGGQTSTR